MTNLVINTIWLLNWQMDCCDEYGRFTSLDHWHVHHDVPPVDWESSFLEPIPMCRTTLISKQTLHDPDPPTISHRSQSLGGTVIIFVRKPDSFVCRGSQPILLEVAALLFPNFSLWLDGLHADWARLYQLFPPKQYCYCQRHFSDLIDNWALLVIFGQPSIKDWRALRQSNTP